MKNASRLRRFCYCCCCRRRLMLESDPLVCAIHIHTEHNTQNYRCFSLHSLAGVSDDDVAAAIEYCVAPVGLFVSTKRLPVFDCVSARLSVQVSHWHQPGRLPIRTLLALRFVSAFALITHTHTVYDVRCSNANGRPPTNSIATTAAAHHQQHQPRPADSNTLTKLDAFPESRCCRRLESNDDDEKECGALARLLFARSQVNFSVSLSLLVVVIFYSFAICSHTIYFA